MRINKSLRVNKSIKKRLFQVITAVCGSSCAEEGCTGTYARKHSESFTFRKESFLDGFLAIRFVISVEGCRDA